MNVEFKRPIMIFRNEYNDNVFYKLGMSKRLQDDTFENGYMDCQFKKTVELNNKTKIQPIKSWISFYINKDGRTVPYIFISEFEIIDDDYYEEVELEDILPDEQETINIDDLDDVLE